jgi:hypothetical protein
MGVYLQTINEIQTAALTALGGKGFFDHGRVVDLSQYFEKSMPLIWLYPFDLKEPNDADFLNSMTLMVGFWFQDDPSSSTDQRKELISKAEDLKTLFFTALKSNSKVDVKNIVSEPQYQMYNGTVSGFASRFVYQNFETCE